MTSPDEWVSQEFANLAQVIHDYDPYLTLEMVPPSEWHKLVDKSKVFRVVDTRNNKIVLYADSLAFPNQILARIWSMDQNKNNVVANLDLEQKAAEALRLRRNLDELEEQREFALFIAKNTKSRWVHNGRVRDDEFRDLGPVAKVIT